MKWSVCCAVAVLASAVAVARASDCCQHCGCSANCSKTCRLVCETKKVTKPDYNCECEDFCVPGRSECSVECDECGHRKLVYTPTCARVHTRVKLVKGEKKEEVKTYKWVVENLCCSCAQKCDAHAAPAASEATPEAPAAREAQNPWTERPVERDRVVEKWNRSAGAWPPANQIVPRPAVAPVATAPVAAAPAVAMPASAPRSKAPALSKLLGGNSLQ